MKLKHLFCGIVLNFLAVLCQCFIPQEYDSLVFAQQWPVTECIIWQKRGKVPCDSKLIPQHFTIHGLWPTKTTKPFKKVEKCNKDDPTELRQQLLELRNVNFCDPKDLQYQWPDVHNPSSSVTFWEYEWEQHGTCAMDNPLLDSVAKYFLKTLELAETFDINTIFDQPNISGGGSYSLINLVNVLSSELSLTCFQLICHYDELANNYYLHEVRIWLNKNLQSVKCQKKHPTCPKETSNEGIVIPSAIPQALSSASCQLKGRR